MDMGLPLLVAFQDLPGRADAHPDQPAKRRIPRRRPGSRATRSPGASLSLVELDLDAAVLAAAVLGAAGVDRPELAEAGGGETVGRDAAGGEVFHHRHGA